MEQALVQAARSRDSWLVDEDDYGGQDAQCAECRQRIGLGAAVQSSRRPASDPACDLRYTSCQGSWPHLRVPRGEASAPFPAVRGRERPQSQLSLARGRATNGAY